MTTINTDDLLAAIKRKNNTVSDEDQRQHWNTFAQEIVDSMTDEMVKFAKNEHRKCFNHFPGNDINSFTLLSNDNERKLKDAIRSKFTGDAKLEVEIIFNQSGIDLTKRVFERILIIFSLN